MAPAGAIMEASREVEIALRDLLRKSGVDERVIARVGIQGLTRSVAEKGLLPRTIAVLQSLIKLRNLAAHGPDQLEPWQAYEFMSLADLVLAEARQQEAAADRVFSPDRPAG
ncbi:hypothetical protein [Nocardia tengchongensis]|uniref:hypothetical protein n=1 Tax=Nocardia tengchongensis TaxID=2055889 RepID=UPI00369EE177